MILLISLVFAHGGEDHGAPAAPVLSADVQRVELAGATTEGVLLVPRSGGTTTLLLADRDTSAPLSATAQLNLSGPLSIAGDFTATPTPGVYTGAFSFATPGTYAGALVVWARDQIDLLAVPSFLHAPSVASTPSRLPWVGGICAAFVVFAVGLLLGRLSRAVGSALLTLGLGLSARAVYAHGGEDHGGGPPPKSAGAALTLPLESQFLLGLRTERVENGPFLPSVPVLAQLVAAPGHGAVLRAPVDGRVRTFISQPGEELRLDQRLAIVDELPNADSRASLAAARADAAARLSAARAALTLATRDAAQIPTLGDALSPRARLEREQALRVAEEQLQQAEQARAALSADATVRAPIAGRLAAVFVRPGDAVQAGDPLFEIVDPGALQVEARLPERYVGQVRIGAPATLRTATGTASATVLAVAPKVDPATGTCSVTLIIADPPPTLIAGMSATVWLPIDRRQDVLLVPDDAVMDAAGVPIVFVKTSAETFEVRELALSARGATAHAVTRGLVAHERVVVAAGYALRSLAGR